MEQHFSNPVQMAAISMQSQHQQGNQQHYPTHGQYQQYYSDYTDSCYQSPPFHDSGFPGEQLGYHSATSVPYGSGIESYLDPKYATNPAAFASRLPYLPFHAAAVAAYGMYDYSFEPAFIRKRNERERQRVKCVNEGYARLREHLPEEYAEKRLSKVETLRGAIMYIKELQSVLGFDPEKEKSKRKNTENTTMNSNKEDESMTEKALEVISSADEKEEGGKNTESCAFKNPLQNRNISAQSDLKPEAPPSTVRLQNSSNDLSQNSCGKTGVDSCRGQHDIPQRYGSTSKTQGLGNFTQQTRCLISPLDCRSEEEILKASSGKESCEHVGSVVGLSPPCSDSRANPNWWNQMNARPHPVFDFADEFHINKSCVRRSSNVENDSYHSTFRNTRHHPYRGFDSSKNHAENWGDALLIKTETQTPPPYEQCYDISSQRENYASYRRGFAGTPHNIFRTSSTGRGGQSDGFKTDTSPESSSGLSP